ncbi:terminase small subunit [Akkermansia glycaniphila]|uniref:terminase small subunit n=1 Tax=Akkermansia glycaniphila TaxID=1679444 RepID=UPI001C00A776|nr:terminase small subunit [Akkermansia glycaniphila]MBT9449981.1 terminase small subunit [Akkermansia glycaniphila]
MKLTEKQKEFARLLVEGKLSKPDAYRKAFSKKGMKDATASKAASRLSKNVELCRYMDSLNADLDKAAILSKQQRMEWLSRVVTTPIGDVGQESDLCQEFSTTESDMGSSVKVKMPGKIEAIRELNKMDGAYEPERVEVKSELSFSSLLAGIAGRTKAGPK